MATIKPFKGLRPPHDLVERVTLVYSVYRLRFLLASLYLLMIRELSLLKIFVGSYPL